MTQEHKMGHNKTPLQVHPIQAKRMLEHWQGNRERAGIPPTDFESYHLACMESGGVVGSIPVPMGMKLLVETGVNKLKGKNQEILLDKLGERLAFERTGVRLYDSLITKLKGDEEAQKVVDLHDIEKIRNQELQHFRMLQQVVEEMGADPTGVTPSADVTGVMSLGLVQVCNDYRIDFTNSLEAILIVELTDNDSWENLIELAENFGQKKLSERCQSALAQEAEHLASVRSWIKALTKQKSGAA